ncbi:MAG: 16S rRNA (cytosine(1402)-N(4))-methyltransferase RsmH [Gammaproteobacteria bacterium]|nr:16S rRNA (cytosine(1402)-N(4))-methyltransferase RsmH [Gammaproteobacteria bacterium]MBU1654201.1 16S rRNA (cytosine(1402)-N(4))-methyltransferase RsmH [Gammaproteobacteria bacterium]MBU1960861.1 16S rRNA (cytosine(1402)-N(4))-methyltransferase RsmH [Gammaproteobacteria bacterium]
MFSRHRPVLLEESLAALSIRPDGRYLDATFGRGGHSGAILERLGPGGALLAIDKDPAAVEHGRKLFAQDDRFRIRQGSFAQLGVMAAEAGWSGVHGVLMDLGVSSPQLDDPERGFSFLRDGPLDMRMDPALGESAAVWLNRAPEREIAWVLKAYGEERFAKRIAAAIRAERESGPIAGTGRLAEVISKAHPAWEKGRHPATRSFQAIRIWINGELDDLRKGLEQSLEVLVSGGRLAVISFHSLEDRIVKRFIRDQARGDDLPRGVPVRADQLNRRLRALGGAVTPGAEEVAANPRARSAVLRAAERL